MLKGTSSKGRVLRNRSIGALIRGIMKTDTSDTNPSTSRPGPAPGTIHSLLADDRRRYAMYYLTRRVGAVTIGDLAEQIALGEGDLSRDRYERIVTGLYHIHLPKLAAAGVVQYDLEEETVNRRPAADALAPYLTLSYPDAE